MIHKYHVQIIVGLLVLHTLLLIAILASVPSSIRAALRDAQIAELGWTANYAIHQDIITSDAYQNQQLFFLNQKRAIYFPDQSVSISTGSTN
jgi:hypothetical protein